MEIVSYNRDTHLIWLAHTLVKHGMSTMLTLDMPKVGFVCLYENLPICAGFLRKVEGNYMILDSLITDPDAHPAIRNQAIDAVVQELINKAKDMGVKKLMANTVDAHTLERSKKHGFKPLEHVVIVLEL